jgi:multidrug efflux pump subunit AcrB
LSEETFEQARGVYERTLHWSVAHRAFILIVFLLTLVATFGMFQLVKIDFIPSEDTGQIFAQTEAANGTSFDQMVRYQAQAAAIVARNPNVDGFMSAVGAGGPTSTANAGRIFINLKPRAQRSESADEIAQNLFKQLRNIPGLKVYVQNPPTIPIGGMRSKLQYQYSLQDLDLKELQSSANRLMEALSHSPVFQDITSDLYLATPSLTVTIDRDRAASLGITPQAVETALGAAFGGEQISNIYASSDTYQVILEVLPRDQQDLTALSDDDRGHERHGDGADAGSVDRRDANGAEHHAAQHQPPGTAAFRHDFVQFGTGLRVERRRQHHRPHRAAAALPPHGTRQLPGHRPSLPELDQQHGRAAAGGHRGRLHRARHPL